jgi:RNA recognition motif-containing protein
MSAPTQPTKTIESESDSDGWEQVGASKKHQVFDDTQSIPFVPGIRTIIARNLPRDIRLDTLRGIFTKYGPICDIYIPKNADKSSNLYGTIKGFALIKFLKPEDTVVAFMDNYRRLKIGSNTIHLESAKMDR